MIGRHVVVVVVNNSEIGPHHKSGLGEVLLNDLQVHSVHPRNGRIRVRMCRPFMCVPVKDVLHMDIGSNVCMVYWFTGHSTTGLSFVF